MMLLLGDNKRYLHSSFGGEIKPLGKSDVNRTRKYNLVGRHTMVRGIERRGSNDLKIITPIKMTM